MIVKKVKSASKKKNKPKHQSINDLLDYIREPHRVNPYEKVVMSGGRGFIFDSHIAQKTEMIALAQTIKKSKMPVQHWIFSWHEGEQPTEKQINETVDILQKEMGLEGHQLVWGVHADTDNWHLHIAVNRVHPDTGKIVEVNKGFDLEVAHRIVAKVEFLQGWQREKNGRYACTEDGEAARVAPQLDNRAVSQKAVDFEAATGEKSLERIAQERGLALIRQAATWGELHNKLAEVEMRFEAKGSGATIFVGDMPVKASAVARDCSMKALTKRLGEFEPPQESFFYEHKPRKFDSFPPQRLAENRLRRLSECHLASDSRKGGERKPEGFLPVNARADRRTSESLRWDSGQPEPVSRVNRAEWDLYVVERQKNKKDKEVYKKRIEELKMLQSQEWKQLADKQQQERQDSLAGNWKGRGRSLNALRSVLAVQQAIAKQTLKDKHKKVLATERTIFRQQFSVFPRFEEWLRLRGEAGKAEAWRYRAEPDTIEPGAEAGEILQTSGPHGIANFGAYVVGKHGNVHYSQHDGEPAAFTDVGSSVLVHASTDREAVLAAMQLGVQKWGAITLKGSDRYKQLCITLAVEHGIRVVNPELQQSLTKEKEKFRNERGQQRMPNEAKAFTDYHTAVGAERYRVTAIRMFANEKDKKTFILDKQNGVTKGFSAEQLLKKLPEMLRLQEKGENIYYTPLSEKKHHILIDDMTVESVNRFRAEGFKSAALIQSSPGNFQCILTIPKLGTEFDREVGNRLTEMLNQEYGDKKLSGCIHPHRAPGFENKKPKHRQDNGQYPEVKLLEAIRQECPKSLELSKQLNAEIAQKSAESRERAAKIAQEQKFQPRPGSPMAAYQAHLTNIRQHLTIEDASRVDSMIALRMRATGHTQEAVRQVIEECAPAMRESSERRDWKSYAQRTSAYAFGGAGDRDLTRNEKYIEHWKRIEGIDQQEHQQRRRMR